MTPLPPWDDTMSDGCSVPWALRYVVPSNPLTRLCCLAHDRRYYFGGTAADRLKADLDFATDLRIKADLTDWQVYWWFLAVRVGGHPWLRRPGISWAFGGERFTYVA